MLSDLQPHQSLVMKLRVPGRPGRSAPTVSVGFADAGDGRTTITYDADAVVGGMVGGVGQRMLTSVSRRMAGEFFGNVDSAIAGELVGARRAGPRGLLPGQGFTAPRVRGVQPGVFVRHRRRRRPVLGVAGRLPQGHRVGAGLVLLGVVVGSVFGRRS